MLRRATGHLAARGCDAARLDAELLLADALGVDRLTLYTHHDRPLTPTETDAYRAAIARRARREPLAYLLGRRGFRRLELSVSPDVLIPRPETEVLVEWALDVAPRGGRVLDWGTGSGAVALALADERPDLAVTGSDVSLAALAVARGNDRAAAVEWLASDGFAGLAGRSFDVIAANPPYVSEADLPGLAPELEYEPRSALVSGPTGFEALELLAREGVDHLDAQGWLLSEVGAGQADRAAELWRAAGFEGITTRSDLAGFARVVGGRRT